MTQTITKSRSGFDLNRFSGIALKACAAVAAVCALLLTFTVGDYYIFNRFSEYGFFFCLSQWVKKAGLLLILAAVFFNCKSCADVVKYLLPVFIILSCCLFGGFFDIVTPAEAGSPQEIFNKINLGFPKWLNITLFFVQNVAYAACCALFFVRDGYKARAKSFITLPFALLLTMPLNIFENFFDISKIPADSFLRFYNFTLWHFIALCALVGSTVGLYYYLKNKSREQQDKYLAVIALSLLIQYHSKDSMVMGDGYNVYYTVFACLPLFICNIGVYVASISVILKKRVLYAISFFIHAVGALTVFVYFGKDSMSNYGIFISHSILYFCLTHCMLFALCVLPSALGHYKFKIKDCIIPLIYYCIVIIIAAISSALVTEFLTKMGLSVGEGINPDTNLPFDMTPPNYAFTQVNPLPFAVPNLIPLGGAFRHINVFYVILVYIAYVCLFFAFYGAYRAFLAVRKVVLAKLAERRATAPAAPAFAADSGLAEVAATDESADDEPTDEPAATEPANENPEEENSVD
ncbi:MAG: YwaF family protein [Clostridiales bacterium]|nr:YwaF family protein [Clostridiales bacterium]